MGGTISSNGPNLEKKSFDNLSHGLRIGSCEMQGWRSSMEDAIIFLPDFDPKHNTSLFAICDGHGGSIISKFVAENYPEILYELSSYQNQNYEQALIEANIKLDELLCHKEVNKFLLKMNNSERIQNEFLSKQEANKNKENKCKFISVKYNGVENFISNNITLLHNSNKINNQKYNSTSPDSENESDNSFDSDCENELYNNNITNDDVNNINLNKFIANDMGTTANIVLITPSHIYISNVGDSLSVMYKNNQAIQLNQEHKTTLKSEYDRIQKSGEFIINNRIKGKLNLTRAIGDFQFKSSPHLKFYEQSVIAFPEITKIKRTDDINYIIMGCDGVWDCVEKQGLCEEIDKICNKEPNKMLSNIISDIFNQIISKTNNIPIGTDNMSCIVIQFCNKRT